MNLHEQILESFNSYIAESESFDDKMDLPKHFKRMYIDGELESPELEDFVTADPDSSAYWKAADKVIAAGKYAGMKVKDAEVLFDKFHILATTGERSDDMGKLSVLAGVHKYPSRVKCATLAWHTFRGALNNSQKIIKTE